METQCTPSRSSLMTGRWAIRSGTHSVPFGGRRGLFDAMEVTIGEALSDAGYATGYYGKWHLGTTTDVCPTIRASTNGSAFPVRPTSRSGRLPRAGPRDIMPAEQMMEGRKGEKSRPLGVYDVTQRRLIDADITRRAVSFIERRPTLVDRSFCLRRAHATALAERAEPAFKGRTGNGDWADMLAEMDANVGRMLDAVDRARQGKHDRHLHQR